jgi:hypothetical protein
MSKKNHKGLQQTIYKEKSRVSIGKYNDYWYTIILPIFDQSIK